MIEQIRYRFLMMRLRKEIARTVNGKQRAGRNEKIKSWITSII